MFFLSKMSVRIGSTDRVHRESIGRIFIGQNSRCLPTGGMYHIPFILPESVTIYPSWHLLLSACNSSHQMCINNCASQLEKSSLTSKYFLRAVFNYCLLICCSLASEYSFKALFLYMNLSALSFFCVTNLRYIYPYTFNPFYRSLIIIT